MAFIADDHYYKLPLRDNETFPTPDASRLYSVMPDKALTTLELLKTSFRKDPERVMKILLECGAAKKVSGVALSKFLRNN